MSKHLTPEQHQALDARDDLLAIVHAWPDLLGRLGREGSSGYSEKVTGSKAPGLVINEHISDLMAEIRDWVNFLGRQLCDETDWTPPPGGDTAITLHHIATHRIGFFTTHPDEGLRQAFRDDSRDMRDKAERGAYPDGYRTLDTRLPCEHHDTSDLGERIPCAGTYTVRPRRDGSEPDLICSRDNTHRIPPSEWSRGRWKIRHAPAAARLVEAIQGA